MQMAVFTISADNVEMQMRHPAMMFGTDGLGVTASGPLSTVLAHPRLFGTYPRILGHYVREEHVLTLGEASWKASGFPAQRLGLWDRGVIAKGNRADLIVFDPATIADRATYASPREFPSGIEHVFVNGKAAVADGRLTGERAGVVLRRGR
jgi:N-acyl-D-amino-acid deacylase